MGWLEFIADIFSSIAWPLIVLLIAIIFKRELSNIVNRMDHFKYKDLDIAFENIKKQTDETLATTEQESSDNPIIPSRENVINSSLKDQAFNAAELFPPSSILLAWSSLEAAIASAVARLGISPDSPSYRSVMHNIDMISKYTDISQNLIKLMNDLRKLRNEVAHPNANFPTISSEQAENYTRAAYDIIKILETINYKMPAK